jgi:shikimate dehydrogenase
MNEPDRYALIGWPLGGGLSAAMHNAAFRSLGLAATYADRPAPPAELPEALDALRRGELAGANVTTPHKVTVRSLLDDEDEVVAATGAVNTIVRTGGRLIGHNTDVAGARAALAELGLAGSAAGRRAVLVGAGGAARAVLEVLLAEGWAVRVLGRSVGRSSSLAAAASRRHPAAALATAPLDATRLAGAVVDADLLVNATPVGGPAEPGSWWPPATPFPPRLALLDLVAFPAETRLVALARAAGARAAAGQTMLVAQAAEAFRLWTGHEAPVEVMGAALWATLRASPCRDR